MADRGGSAGDRRMTKAERKDEARRQREEIRRQMARRRKNRTVFVAVAVVLAAVLVGIVAMTGGSDVPVPADLLVQANDATKAAGCDDVQIVAPFDPTKVTGDVGAAQRDPASVDQNHIGDVLDPTAPKLSQYPTVPPASGPHAPIPPGPLPAGVYDAPPDIYRAIHDLEHGAAIVWYSPDASSEQLQQLKDFYGQRLIDQAAGQDRVIVAPYDYPDQGAAGRLPDGVQMALVAWHRLETCGRVNLAAAFGFTSQYGAPPFDNRQYRGEAPEAGAGL